MDSSFDHHRVIWVQVKVPGTDRSELVRDFHNFVGPIRDFKFSVLIRFWSMDPWSQYVLLRVFDHRWPYIIL